MVDVRKQFQTVEGFGGMFVDATAVNLHRLPPQRREEVLRAYLDPGSGSGHGDGPFPHRP
jgi:glucosylceramidase